MFQLLYPLVHAIQPFLVPICLICAWLLVFLTIWSIWTSISDGVNRTKRLHQIPCTNCQFFTGDYYLKCTVHPVRALSEEAIDCRDYDPRKNPFTAEHNV